MNKTNLIYAFACLTLSFSYGQSIMEGGLSGTRNSGLFSTTPVVLNASVEGTPYINEDFLPATISASQDDVFYVRYNAVADEFEVKGENNKAYALNRYRRDIVVQLVAFKKTYQVFGYLDANGNENFGYFVILNDTDANVKLLKKEKVFFQNEKVATTSYDTAKPASYKRASDEYYIKIGTDNAVKVRNKTKDIAKLFPKNERKILDFAKAKKLKLKKDEDLNTLMVFINGLK